MKMMLAVSLLVAADGLSSGGVPPRRRAAGRRRLADPSTKPLEEWGAFDVPNRIAMTTVAWGDENCGFTKLKKRERGADQFGIEDISAAYNVLQSGGLEVWDVAAGSAGASLLGGCAAANGKNLPGPRVVARCAPTWIRVLSPISSQLKNRVGATGIEYAVGQTLEDVGSAYVDLLLWGPASETRGVPGVVGGGAGTAKGLGMSVGEVGICNVRGGRNIRRAHAALAKRGLKCVACAVDLSLICSGALNDGTLEAAKELDITVFARSPLAQGLGSGKYTISNPTGGSGFGATPKWRPRVLFKFQPLHEALQRVANMVTKRRTDQARADNPQATRVDTTPSQVALHWVVAKGAVPLVACNNQKDANELIGCKGWALTQEEVDILDEFKTKSMPKRKRLPRK